MNVILGVIIIIIALVLMCKKVDSKVILLLAGLLMATLAGSPIEGFKGFTTGLKNTSILEPIIASMGFAEVMKLTGCDKHLIYGMLKILKSEKAKFILLPATMIVTMLINFALNSATATAASMGAVMIPVLIASGYHPAVAAAAILASTYGSILNPGHSSNALVAQISDTTPMEVVSNQFIIVIITFIIQLITLIILIKITKDNKYVSEDNRIETSEVDEFNVNVIKALCVFVPIILLIAGTKIPALGKLRVGHTMIIGCIVGALITKTNPKNIMKEFWKGAGSGFTGTFSIVVCSTVFVAGMTTIGLIDAMTNAFINNPSIAKISASIGPAVMAIVTGTGTGMAVAFNQAVSANASLFGLLPINMGGLVTLGSCMARAVSPVAGVVILTCGIAKCTPMDVIKRQMPGFILALITGAILFLNI